MQDKEQVQFVEEQEMDMLEMLQVAAWWLQTPIQPAAQVIEPIHELSLGIPVIRWYPGNSPELHTGMQSNVVEPSHHNPAGI